MEESSDFTFCHVGTSSSPEAIEFPKTIPDINNMKISDDSSEIGKIASNSFEFQTPPSKDGRPFVQAGSKVIANGSGKPSSEVNRKPVQRAKVPFQIGYSQMDWLKLTRSHPDLAGLKGQSNRRLISMEEVKKHKTDGSVWTVLKGGVYNITPYLNFHPGGVDMLMKAAGKDCTALFNKYHAWVNAEFLLEKCLVGILDDSQ